MGPAHRLSSAGWPQKSSWLVTLLWKEPTSIEKSQGGQQGPRVDPSSPQNWLFLTARFPLSISERLVSCCLRGQVLFHSLDSTTSCSPKKHFLHGHYGRWGASVGIGQEQGWVSTERRRQKGLSIGSVHPVTQRNFGVKDGDIGEGMDRRVQLSCVAGAP